MQAALTQKLWTHIVRNNPDLMIGLQESRAVTMYLEEGQCGVTTDQTPC